MKLGSQTSVIVAGTLVAAAILFSNHWAFAWGGGATYRLNRWTGTITLCAPQPQGHVAAGMGYACQAPPTQP